MSEKLTTVTMKTLATKLGVSVTTVSNAYSKPDRLSTELRDQILATAKDLGYCGPSAAGRALRSGKTDVCGFLFHGGVSYAVSDPYSSTSSLRPASSMIEYGSENAYETPPWNKNPQTSVLPDRKARPAALGPQ